MYIVSVLNPASLLIHSDKLEAIGEAEVSCPPTSWIDGIVALPNMGVKTVDGVATMGEMKAAWFKDTEGNILAITNM